MPVDFMYIGASRSGSTYLHRVLEVHPDIVFPWGKPARFWNRFIDGGKAIGEPKYKQIEKNKYYTDFSTQPNKLKGDMTDGYTQIPVERIKEIKQENPDCKILYCLRNPKEIALSQIGNQISKNSNEITLNELEDYMHGYPINNLSFSDNIKNWKSVFGNNVFVYLYEDLFSNNPRNMIKQICDFIGADSNKVDKIPEKYFTQKVNKRTKTYVFSNEAEKSFFDRMIKEIRETQKVTGLDLTHWIQNFDFHD